MNPSWVGEVWCFRINKPVFIGKLGKMRLKPSSPGPNNQPPIFPVSWKTGSHQGLPRNPGTPQGIEPTNPNLSGPWCWMASARILLRKVVFFLWRCAYRAFVMLCLGPRCGLVGWKKIGLKGSETPKKTPFRQKTLWIGLHQRRKIPCFFLRGNGGFFLRKPPPKNGNLQMGIGDLRWRSWDFQLASNRWVFFTKIPVIYTVEVYSYIS